MATKLPFTGDYVTSVDAFCRGIKTLQETISIAGVRDSKTEERCLSQNMKQGSELKKNVTE